MNMNPIKSTSLQSMNAVKTQPYFVQWYFFGNQIKRNHACTNNIRNKNKHQQQTYPSAIQSLDPKYVDK